MGRPPTQKVKRLLSQLEKTAGNPSERTEIVTELLEIFGQFPHLICQQYMGKAKASPLHVLLKAGVNDVATIQSLLQLCPNAADLLELEDSEGDLPLHSACRWCSSSSGVIEFLMRLNPALFLQENNKDLTPLEIILGFRNIPSSTIELLLKYFPQVAVSKSLAKFVVEKASYPRELVEKFVEVFPEEQAFLKLNIWRTDLPYCLERTQVMCKLLPKLSTLHLRVPTMSGEAFVYLMNHLQQNQSLADMNFEVEERVADWGSDCFEALELTLATNKSLQDVRLVVPNNGGLGLRCLQAIKQGFAKSTAIESLEYISNLFQLKLRRPGSTGNATESTCATLAAQRHFCKHREEFLCLRTVDFSNPYFVRFFKGIPKVLQLTSLNLQSPLSGDPPPKATFTDDMVTLLKEAPGLRFVSLFRYNVDMLPILEVLKTNRHLEHFNAHFLEEEEVERGLAVSACLQILKEHNVTLQEVCPLSRYDSGIKYYLNLNRMGRSAMRNANITGNEVVQRVLAPWEDGYLSAKDRDLYAVGTLSARQSIVYGLLRELPGSWCHDTVPGVGSPSLLNQQRKGLVLYQYEHVVSSLVGAAPSPLVAVHARSGKRKRSSTGRQVGRRLLLSIQEE